MFGTILPCLSIDIAYSTAPFHATKDRRVMVFWPQILAKVLAGCHLVRGIEKGKQVA
jgi:hypothetical protein